MLKHLAMATLSAALLAACATAPKDRTARPAAITDGATLDLAILETTDVHSNILSYDYYKQKDDPSFGYERVATLIREARKEFPSTLLFDSGDTIQGSVLADFQAHVKPVGCDTEASASTRPWMPWVTTAAPRATMSSTMACPSSPR